MSGTEKVCSCVNFCKGREGLSARYVCALEQKPGKVGVPPTASPKPAPAEPAKTPTDIEALLAQHRATEADLAALKAEREAEKVAPPEALRALVDYECSIHGGWDKEHEAYLNSLLESLHEVVEDISDNEHAAAALRQGTESIMTLRKARDDAREAIIRLSKAAALSTPSSGWQDIETAPKDGRWVLLYSLKWRDGGKPMLIPAMGYWSQASNCWACYDGQIVEPQFWHVLPAPPAGPATEDR